MNAFAADSTAVVMPDLWVTLLKSVGVLCIVLALLTAVLLLLKRFYGRQGRFAQQGAIKVLSNYFLAPKERIVLIDVQGEKVLLGVTPYSINRLARISTDIPPDAVASAGFIGCFKKLLKKNADDAESGPRKT